MRAFDARPLIYIKTMLVQKQKEVKWYYQYKARSHPANRGISHSVPLERPGSPYNAPAIRTQSSMPIKVIEPQRLYRQISDQLRTLIIAGEFPVGSRLPSERDLAVQLGVSRPSLREALIALEVQGYIEVRMGSGIYICEPPSPSRARPDLSGEEGPLEVIQARTVLEGEVAAIAAKAGRKPHYDAIEEAIDMMEADARAGIKPVEADRLFHVRIAEARSEEHTSELQSREK